MTMRSIIILGSLIFFLSAIGCNSKIEKNNLLISETFADHWEFVGIAVEEPGFTIWGTSPIMDKDGKVHLFVARWPCELKVDPGWRSHSEIAHYVGDGPMGPFRFSDIAVTGTGLETWDKYGAHNPSIHKVGNKFVLIYIANNDPNQPPHPANQRIGMVISDSPNGPWKKVKKHGMVLAPPENQKYWNYNSGNGVNNPALLQHPNGGFFLYFKSDKSKMGLAVAENIEGPYVQMPFPVTANNKSIEDGYAYLYKGKIALLTTDNHGIIEEGGGILWTSEDGIHFNTMEQGFKHINEYVDINLSEAAVHYGPGKGKYAKFERPQLLIIDEEPAYMYAPSGTNIYGGDCTISYVLKFVK